MEAYVKDKDGRIKVNTGEELTAKVANDPTEPGKRNASGIVYFKDGDEVAVVVTIGGVPYATIASFTAKAEAGKMSAVHVRARAYASVEEPPEPQEEPSEPVKGPM